MLKTLQTKLCPVWPAPFPAACGRVLGLVPHTGQYLLTQVRGLPQSSRLPVRLKYQQTCGPRAHPSSLKRHQALSSADEVKMKAKRAFESLIEEPAIHPVTILSLYVALFFGAVIFCYQIHPQLLSVTADSWNLKPSATDDSSFEQSFLSLVSILYGLIASNTFLFTYEQQVSMTQELYGEVYALELILLNTFFEVQSYPDIHVNMSLAVRRYIKEELFNCAEMESPFMTDSAYMQLMKQVKVAKDCGCNVTGMSKALDRLASCQSRRSSVAAAVLPILHWAFIHTMEIVFIITFLVFDAAGLTPEQYCLPEHQLGFSVLIGLVILTSLVLHDMADPSKGLYSVRFALKDRLHYVSDLIRLMEEEGAGSMPPGMQVLYDLQLSRSSSLGNADPSSQPHARGKGRMAQLPPE